MPEPIQEISLSRYAAQRLAARPEWAAELADPAPFARAEMDAALAAASADEREFARALRELRSRVLLRVMARDLAGRAPLAEVCATMSDLAEAEIAAACARLEAPGLLVVAMGKLGGRELNVSSDIDLVFLHLGPPEAQEASTPESRSLPQSRGQTVQARSSA